MPDSLSVCLSVALATVIVLATTVSGLLTSNEKKEILRAHNYFRRNVQPLATNMIKLVSSNIFIDSPQDIYPNMKAVYEMFTNTVEVQQQTMHPEHCTEPTVCQLIN